MAKVRSLCSSHYYIKKVDNLLKTSAQGIGRTTIIIAKNVTN